MADDRFQKGMAMRKAILGEDHVARAEARKTEFDADFQRFITETAWGSVWTRPGLDPKIRSMLAIAMLAALGRKEELALHVRATRNTGVSADELKEILMQVAVYAGVPAANTAFAVAKAVFAAPGRGAADAGHRQ